MTHPLRPFVAVTLLALGCGGDAASGPQIRIDRFNASPANVAPGETSTTLRGSPPRAVSSPMNTHRFRSTVNPPGPTA